MIDVQMVKVRKALEKVGVQVRTEWGSGGWAIPAADKAKLRKLMAGESPVNDLGDALVFERRMAFLAGA